MKALPSGLDHVSKEERGADMMATIAPLTAMDSITLSAISPHCITRDRWRGLIPVQVQASAGAFRRHGVDTSPSSSETRHCKSRFSRFSNALSKNHQVTAETRRLLCGTLRANGSADVGGTGESVSASANDGSVLTLKRAVMNAVSNTNRGKNTTYQQRQSILKLLEELEELNPTADPIESSLFSRSWALLYTAPVNEKTADKYAGTEEGPFLARIKPAAFGSVRQIRSTQVLDTVGGTAANIAYFVAFGVNGSLDIKGSVKKSAVTAKGANRVDVTFESFVLKFGDWTLPKISLGWINPKGWIDTTFLDKDMRIGRGDKGSIFVAVGIKES